MPPLIALDVALLLPPEITTAALATNAVLPRKGFQGLRLDDSHLPHITLTQQFIAADDIEDAVARVGGVASGTRALHLRVVGAGRSGGTVWMSIDHTPALAQLHRSLMETLEPLEAADGDSRAFVDGDARPSDVAWVGTFRAQAGIDAYLPHVTIGHSVVTPRIDARDFVASRLAACQLGRFCTCRRILAEWSLP